MCGSSSSLLDKVRGLCRYDDTGRATGYVDAVGWVEELLGPIRERTGVHYTIVAYQGYRDGGAVTDWHSDDPFDEQAILSLGAARTFGVRRRGREEGATMTVKHGDMVVMGSGFQREFEHAVLADPGAGERVALVFRTPRLD